jgi:hypothetical protein
VAVDDVGTGFSGLEQILRLEPDILEIDGALVRDIDRLSGHEAMVAALVAFAGPWVHRWWQNRSRPPPGWPHCSDSGCHTARATCSAARSHSVTP